LQEVGEFFHFGINYLVIATKAEIVTWLHAAGLWPTVARYRGVPEVASRAGLPQTVMPLQGVDLAYQTGQYSTLCLFMVFIWAIHADKHDF
jgi:hypothetical protein